MINKLYKLFQKIFKNDSFSNSCFYINSNNILPPPLDEMEELRLLQLVGDGDMEARNTLIVHNLRLVVFIAKKFESSKVPLEDLISIGSMGLIKGVQTFKIDKNIKLATYASRCIENEILMYLRKIQKLRQEVSLDEVLSVDSDGNEMMLADVLGDPEPLAINKMTKDEDLKNLYFALNKLKKREREIIIMRFGLFETEQLTQKEVADKLGISQSYISRLEKRIMDKMRHEIENMIKVA